MPYIHCPECYGDPMELGKASYQLVEMETIGDLSIDGYYICPSCGLKMNSNEFVDRWRAMEEDMNLAEEQRRQEKELIEQGLIDDYEEYNDDLVDEFGRPY